MIKIGITGSLSSGKTTVSKILSSKKHPLFSADNVVKNLYKKDSFKKLISKKLGIKNKLNLKKMIKEKILKDKSNVKKLENIVHPLVRKEMRKFVKKNINRNQIFFEIPLLIESKLMKNFDIILFVKARKKIRLKRFKLKGGDEKLFHILNNKQFSDQIKMKHCDYIINNEKNIKILKKKLSDILNRI